MGCIITRFDVGDLVYHLAHCTYPANNYSQEWAVMESRVVGITVDLDADTESIKYLTVDSDDERPAEKAHKTVYSEEGERCWTHLRRRSKIMFHQVFAGRGRIHAR